MDTTHRMITSTEPVHTGLLGECQSWGRSPMVQTVYSRSLQPPSYWCVSLTSFPLWDSTSGCYWPSATTEQKLNASCTLAWFYHSHENGGRGEHTLCNENFPSVYFNNISLLYDYQKSISIFSVDIYGILRLCAREGRGFRFLNKAKLCPWEAYTQEDGAPVTCRRETTACIRCWQTSAWRRIKQSKKDEGERAVGMLVTRIHTY